VEEGMTVEGIARKDTWFETIVTGEEVVKQRKISM
jgi:hypothetical protein